MKNDLFSGKTKMADLVLANYRLLYVFPCFGLGLSWGESTVQQVCERTGISVSLFLLVCNLHTFDDYDPDADCLAQISLDDLMKYLKSCHKEYLENRMPEIVSSILNLVGSCCVKHGELLTGFCEKYRQEVMIHFGYEEKVVFPYIESLLGGEKTGYYKIREYEQQHSNIEVALHDLKNIILKYLPPECTIDKCRDVLIELFLFESDLAKHTLLEECILIALVERIENTLAQ
jgi:regulator of cell morphogenesis and NO signaling